MADLEENQDNSNNKGSPWSVSRVVGVLLIVLAGLIIVYLTVGLIAFRSGENLRTEREEQLRVEQLEHQIALAQENIGQGSFNLALRRLEWVLEQDPENEEAQALRRQAEGALKTALTPDASPMPSPSPEPSPTPGGPGDEEQELDALQRLAQQENWPELIDRTIDFQRRNPNFKRLETDRLLYTAYLNQGLIQIQGDQIELGIYHLTQAEKLGDLTQEALDYWLWAELYQQGIAYYGVSWGPAISFFRDLCLAAPFYQGACDKLYDSLVAYGDQYASAMEWCPAVDYYREARQYGGNQTLDTKLSQAVQGCADATPTPAAITTTLPADGIEVIVPPDTNE